MKILEYPTVLGKEVRCDLCGCVFKVNKFDLKKRGSYNCVAETGDIRISMLCPCCRHPTILNKTSLLDEILQSKYAEINKVFKNKAMEISKSDKVESRQEVSRVVDDLYNAILDIENN